MRVVVAGGGVVGLLTAMECTLAGARVELVDPAGFPSRQATSYDRHRVVRALHRGDPALTAAAVRAHRGWLEVERRLGTRLYHQVGALTAVPAGQLDAELARLAGAGAAGRGLSAGELAGQYPVLRFPAGLAAVFEPAAGAVLADRMLAALAGWLRDRPGVRLHSDRVVAVDERSGAVRLAGGAALAGDRVVLAAGPWSRELVPAAVAGDLVLYRQSTLAYTPPPEQRAAWAGVPAVPALGTGTGAWLMPPVAGTPVRLSAASACRAVPELTDRATPQHWREHLVGQFRELLPGFDPAAVTGATDGYYLAGAGGGPVLAGYGGGTVWAYAACGGMSFKFAPLVARALADRALADRALADRVTGRPPRRTGLDPVDRPRILTPGEVR